MALHPDPQELISVAMWISEVTVHWQGHDSAVQCKGRPIVIWLWNDAGRLGAVESTGVFPQPNDYRSALILYDALMPLPMNHHLTDRHSHADQLLRIRMESHRAPGILQQLRLAVRYGLTCKLYTLSSRVDAVKVKIEVCWNVLLIHN